jgi:hypothetical protein
MRLSAAAILGGCEMSDISDNSGLELAYLSRRAAKQYILKHGALACRGPPKLRPIPPAPHSLHSNM